MIDRVFSKYKLQKEVCLISVFFSVCVIWFLNPAFKNNFPVTSFRRIIGHGLLHGVDIEKRIMSFYIWLFILGPLVFFSIFVLFSKLYNVYTKNFKQEKGLYNVYTKNFKQEKGLYNDVLIFLNIITIIGMLSFLPMCVNNSYYLTALSLCLILSTLFFCRFYKSINISFDVFKCLMFVSIALSNFFILFTKGFYHDIKFMLYFFVIIILLIVVLRNINLEKNKIKRLQVAGIPLMYNLFFISVFLELVNILNQYNIIIQNKKFISIMIFGCVCMCTYFLYFFTKRFNLTSFRWEKFYYPALILSFSFISVQPNLQTFINTDLFESANHGLAVSEFFKYGKLPIVETFDAHMMSNTVWGIIYGFLNHDFNSAIFVPYLNYMLPILLLLFYKLLKEFFCDEDTAFFILIGIPLHLPVFLLDFGFLAIISLLFAMKKNKFRTYLLYFCSLIIICLYKLDSGMAYSFATMISFVIIYLTNNRKYDLKKFILAGIITIISSIILFYSLCYVKGVNGFNRSKEALGLILSNVNWAYNLLGNANSVSFYLCYMIIPLIVLCLCFFINTKKYKISSTQLVVINSLAIAYFFNLSRGMVRHSLIENQLGLILFSSILCISLFLSLFNYKYNKLIFITMFSLSSTVVGLLLPVENFNFTGLTADFFGKVKTSSLFNIESNKKVERMILTEDFKKSFEQDVNFINSVLEQNETYLDFTNQSLLYTLSNHEKPVYINQSPGLLSGEFTQMQFIQQIESNKNAIFVLVPERNNNWISIDGINDCFRNYLVSEYISKKFKPLCCNHRFVLWVKKDMYERIYNRCVNKHIPYEFCNYTAMDNQHTYNLEEIPFIWGNYDNKNASSNKVYQMALIKSGSIYKLHHDKISKDKGNYLLIETTTELSENDNKKANVVLGLEENNNFEPKSIFSFNLKDGNNKYLIRISSDFYWYTNLINALKIDTTDANPQSWNIKILEGD